MRTLAAALALSLAAFAAPAAHAATDRADAGLTPLDLVSATLRQDGNDLVFSLRTRGEWASRAMTSRPGRSLCLTLIQGGRRFVCASAKDAGGPRLTVNGAGGSPSPLAATIDRPSLRVLNARFAARAAGLSTGNYSWTVTSTWADAQGCATSAPGCNDRLPDRGAVAARLLPPTPTGCVARGESYRGNGPRDRRAVALTFDDGPGGGDTGRVLDILRRTGSKGTFFMLGNRLGDGAALARRALREGHDLANHSFNHANLSGGGMGQLTSTSAAIRRVTGYTPCLFRAPYGAVSGTLIGQARSLGMLTIQWDVDPRDWARPGSGAIAAGGRAGAARVLGGVRNGSIVVMHDGGGPRDQTVAALPSIVATLKRRGYRVVSMTELLGLRKRYG